jgi:hypothetical protein
MQQEALKNNLFFIPFEQPVTLFLMLHKICNKLTHLYTNQMWPKQLYKDKVHLIFFPL